MILFSQSKLILCELKEHLNLSLKRYLLKSRVINLMLMTPRAEAKQSVFRNSLCILSTIGLTASASLVIGFLAYTMAETPRGRLMIAGVLLAGIVSLSGCGAQNGFNGQAVKNYSLTVTATSGQIAHSFDVNLNLQ